MSTVPTEWRTIETAPKSTAIGRLVIAHNILAYCPDEGAIDPDNGIKVCWWEPLMNDGRGCWWGDGDYEHRPTHWMALPAPPVK